LFAPEVKVVQLEGKVCYIRLHNHA
jgi:hypothetical protein